MTLPAKEAIAKIPVATREATQQVMNDIIGEDGPVDLERLDGEELDEAVALVERVMGFRAKMTARHAAELKSILKIAELVERQPGETPFLAAKRAIEEYPEKAAKIQRRHGIAA